MDIHIDSAYIHLKPLYEWPVYGYIEPRLFAYFYFIIINLDISLILVVLQSLLVTCHMSVV